MRPRLALIPSQLHGFLKVNATLGVPEVRLANFNDEMPVLQIEEAGIVLELEFLDQKCLVEFVTQLSALVPAPKQQQRGSTR